MYVDVLKAEHAADDLRV